MRIGVVPDLDPAHGGACQYSATMLVALGRVAANVPSHRFHVYLRPGQAFDRASLEWADVTLDASLLDRAAAYLRARVGNGALREGLRRARRILRGTVTKHEALGSLTPLSRWARAARLDWILYTAPDLECLRTDTAFAMPIFDLAHRLHPEFPEVSAGGEWEQREYLYREGTRRAMLVIADSEIGKKDILRLYGEFGITDERIKVLPYVPAPGIGPRPSTEARDRTLARYGLRPGFFFYPAQFWPHKNHLRIVQALGRMQRSEATVVFCGSHSGKLRTETFRGVMAEAERLGVAACVRYLGYVPDEDMAALYCGARALVMPTFFGPTNIPVVEAWALGCPVITSDLRGIREHAGDAALLVDPASVDAIAGAMRTLLDDEGVGAELAARGRLRAAGHDLGAFAESLERIVLEACERAAAPRAAAVSA